MTCCFWDKAFKDEWCSLDNAYKKILHSGNNIKEEVFRCINLIGVCNPLILVDCSLSERDPADVEFSQHNREVSIAKMAVAEEKFDLSELKAAVNGGGGGVEEEEVEEEEDVSSSSDSEIGDALDLLDSKDDDYGFESGFTLNSRRPNAHGGIHSRHNSSTLQPLSNKNQKFSKNIRASPLEEWEGRLNVGMSNSVTTAIRESVRDMAIGKTKTTEKADRATVEQAIDPRTRMVLFKMLNRGVFHDINGCISTGKEANVYHATKSDGQELAIKVYKTSVLVFKIEKLSHSFVDFAEGRVRPKPWQQLDARDVPLDPLPSHPKAQQRQGRIAGDVRPSVLVVEEFFNRVYVPLEKQAKLVAISLKVIASSWWDLLQRDRICQGKLVILSWKRMKKKIKDQFLQFDFGNDLQSQRCYNNKLEATTCAMKEDIIEHTLSKRV
ncbi:Serine/threonine-protein kinase RIO1 [Morus notabilis]|uniref:Serine/threonine-protein kinase RIO1 n=1 Tax=Morus notabilis TaxID=981085 RepID=W9RRV7_9ROSA|nr:Serine/threonine-protein kinase RIO1 [Morus notabilis]